MALPREKVTLKLPIPVQQTGSIYNIPLAIKIRSDKNPPIITIIYQLT
jgi:hypothetical protein